MSDDKQNGPALRTDVPMDWMGAMAWEPSAKIFEETAIGTAGGRAVADAMDALYHTFGEVQDAHKSLEATVAKDKNAPVRMVDGRPQKIHGRETELANAATTAFGRAGQTFDSKMKVAHEAEAKLRGIVNDKLRVPPTAENVAMAGEVRSMLRSMRLMDRSAFVASALNNGELTIVSAALNAPSSLSGLDAKMQAELRETAADKFAPVEARTARALRVAIGKAEQARDSFVRRMAHFLTPPASAKPAANAALAKLANG